MKKLTLIILLMAGAVWAKCQDTYCITRGDVIDVTVMEHPEFSINGLMVLPDGYIQYPALGNIKASGMNTASLSDTIHKTLLKYVVNPIVTVFVRKIEKQQLNIFGYVNKPGQYQVYDSTSLFDAIAMAGGIKSIKRVREVHIVRSNHTFESVKITDYLNKKASEMTVPMVNAGDTIYIVEPREFNWSKGAFIVNTVSLLITVISLIL